MYVEGCAEATVLIVRSSLGDDVGVSMMVQWEIELIHAVYMIGYKAYIASICHAVVSMVDKFFAIL